MLRSTVLMLAVALLVVAENREWRIGKVLDSKSSKSSVATGATTYTNGDATADGSFPQVRLPLVLIPTIPTMVRLSGCSR